MHMHVHAFEHKPSGIDPLADAFIWEKFGTPQSIPNDTATTLTNWSSTVSEASAGTLDDGFNPTTGLYTAVGSFWYLASAQVRFAAGGTGYRQVALSNTIGSVIVLPPGASVEAEVPIQGINNFGSFGTQVESVVVKHTQGASLDVVYAMFTLYRLATI